MSQKLLPAILVFTMLGLSVSALAADEAPAASTHNIPYSIDLGAVHVQGQQAVINALQTIKLGLETPISSSPADQNKIVCRISRPLGEMKKFLDCSTNRFYAQRREQAQLNATVNGSVSCVSTKCDKPFEFQNMVRGLISNQPDQHLRMEINPYKLRKLLNSLPPLPKQKQTENTDQKK